MPNFTENSRKEFEKFTDISRAPLPLFQVAMLCKLKGSSKLNSTFLNNEYLLLLSMY